MNAGLKMSFKNSYHVELIDSSTGKLKQSGDFHNIATINMSRMFTGCYTAGSVITSQFLTYHNIFARLQCGSGTTSPAFTDTALAKPLWYTDVAENSSTLETKTYEWIDDYTLKGTCVFTFPASSSYVGTVTEVGLWARKHANVNNDLVMVTHALLTDSEGQSISFNKTDTDILQITVIVEASLNSTDANFKIFKQPMLLEILLDASIISSYSNYYADLSRTVGYTNLCRFDWDIENHHNKAESYQSNRYVYYEVSNMDEQLYNTTSHEAYYDASTCYAKQKTVRLASTTVTDEHYFKYITIPTIGYWELPNENVLPTYTISGIPIGTGDGSTVSFDNPLNYFKKDTEKIYKNGVQLTRNVDYTVNNRGNKDCLPEVSQTNRIVKVTSNVNMSAFELQVNPLMRARSIKNDSYESGKLYDVATNSPAFNANSPLYIEYEEEVTLNCLKCTGGIKNIVSPSGYNNLAVGTLFYVDYSTDGETYEQAGSVATTSSTADFSLDFEAKTAKYWRIRTSYSGGGLVGIPRDDQVERYMTLNYKDPYIVFTTAPAEGDILTMDVGMDLMMKNSNFVIDITWRLDFTF